jgi:hypothetical protein
MVLQANAELDNVELMNQVKNIGTEQPPEPQKIEEKTSHAVKQYFERKKGK